MDELESGQKDSYLRQCQWKLHGLSEQVRTIGCQEPWFPREFESGPPANFTVGLAFQHQLWWKHTQYQLARKGKFCEENRHIRECYVLAKKKYHKKIEHEIKNIPDYFKNQETIVNFVSDIDLFKLKSDLSHKGEIISNFKTLDGSNCQFNFKLKTKSNPSLTATIMIRYIEAIQNLKTNNQTGAFTPLEIPAIYLFKNSQKEKIINKLC